MALDFTTENVSDELDAATNSEARIHIRIQQRNGRKTITTIENVPEDIDCKLLLKVLKQRFQCNGHVIDQTDTALSRGIQLQGDHRIKAFKFLTVSNLCKKENIQIHGF